VRIALVGGATAYSPDVAWPQSLGFILQQYLHQGWRWPQGRVPTSVADLSYPSDTARNSSAVLDHFQYLQPDIVCLLTGHNDLPDTQLPPSRRDASVVFRLTGYMPVVPAWFRGQPLFPASPQVPVDVAWLREHRRQPVGVVAPAACPPRWSAYCDAILSAIDRSLGRGQRVLVASEPLVSAAHLDQQRALAAAIALRYAGDARVRFADLGMLVDPLDPVEVADGWKLTPHGIERFADGLFTALQPMVIAS
jgi:hypothetical protein